MMPIKDNQDVACFLCMKHTTWKGKYGRGTGMNSTFYQCFYISRYKRIFSVGTNGISTYNPSNLEITNRWAYSDFISVTPLRGSQNEFQITMKKEKKIDKMTFSTEHRIHLLTEALKFRNSFLEKPKEILVINIYKFANV